MTELVLSVSEFVALVSQTLETAFPIVTLEGEISGSRPAKHFYFDIKDQGAVQRCVKWGKMPAGIEDGMQVRITGRPKLHPQYGYSFIVEAIEPAGEGALLRAYELLKRQLEAEGLFTPGRKRPIPEIPRRIGLITSSSGDAIKDFLKILDARWGGADVSVADVQVQGEAAAGQIISAIEYFNQLPEPMDVLVITRGGGSIEDLQVFNTDDIASAVAASRTPTVVGVGHERNVSLAELAADLRAATPTDAARLVVPDKTEVLRHIDSCVTALDKAVTLQAGLLKAQVNHNSLSLESFMQHPKEKLQTLSQTLSFFGRSLLSGILEQHARITELRRFIIRSQRLRLETSNKDLISSMRILASQNPKLLLKKGYAIPRVKGRLVRAASDVGVGEELMLQLAKGYLDTEVKHVKSG